MKSIAIAALLMAAAAGSPSDGASPVLLSIYDGWGGHYIPGLGKVSASDVLQCGKLRPFIRVVENSEEGGPISAERVQELRSINAATLASLAAAGNACPKPAFSAEA